MTTQVPHTHDHRDQEPMMQTESATIKDSFGAAQIVAVIIGVILLSLGGIGLIRTGLHSMTRPVISIGGLTMTPALVLLNLGIGALAVFLGASRLSAKRGLLVVGPLLIAAGIIGIVQSSNRIGLNENDGVLYLILGLVATLSAILTPGGIRTERTMVTS